ncbi:MAG: nucleotide exchange factor GrpE [Pirellulaceae bacterium]
MTNDEKPVDDATPAASSSREEDQASHEARSAIDEALQDAVDEVMNEEMFSAADAAELAPEVDELGQLLLKVEEAEQRALRNQAELENFRKRVYREMAVERQYSEESLLRELLQVVDNLDRAYQAASDDSSENTGILQGMQMVRQQFLAVLESHHCKRIEAQGAPFDPNFHEAISQSPHDEIPTGHVIQVVVEGYVLHDRVLRPTQVLVSSGSGEQANT